MVPPTAEQEGNMFARVVTTRSDPSNSEKLVRLYRQYNVSVGRGLEGFRGAYLLYDRATGKSVGMTLWATEADLHAGDPRPAVLAQITETLALTQPPEIEVFEVVDQTLEGGGTPEEIARFARLTRSRVSPEEVAQARDRIRAQSPLATVYALPGFQGAFLLVDPSTGKILNVSLWESAETLRDSAGTAASVATQTAQEFGAAPPLNVETYEIVSQAWRGSAAKPADATRSTVLRFFELVNARDSGDLETLVSPDVAWNGRPLGLASFRQNFTGMTTAFPDARWQVHTLVGEGDQVTMRMTMEGTHQGPYLGFPPTGKRVQVTELAMYRVADGKIAEVWYIPDRYGILQQLGLLPGPGPAG
jgi:steroid delta-isomerase-like uncharacterized protein